MVCPFGTCKTGGQPPRTVSSKLVRGNSPPVSQKD